MSKTVIEIDVTEEADRYVAEEPDLSTPDAMIQTAQNQHIKPYTMGKLLAIAKHRGETFDDVPQPKMSLFMGYGSWYNRYLVSLKERVKLASGKVVTVNRLVCSVAQAEDAWDAEQPQIALDMDVPAPPDAEPDDDPSPVSWDTEQAADRAYRYLVNVVPGYIIGRVNILAANDRDFWAAWRELSEKVEAHLAGLG